MFGTIIGRSLIQSSFLRRVWLPVAACAAIAMPVLSGLVCRAQVPAQTQASVATFRLPVFGDASVTFSDPTLQQRRAGMFASPGGEVRAVHLTLGALIWYALDVQQFQVVGGPAWIHQDLFDIVARPSASLQPAKLNPPSANSPLSEEQRLMLQSLLIDRFHLRVHQESNTGRVFVPLRDRKRSDLHSARHGKAPPWIGSNVGTGIDGDGLVGKNVSMPLLAARLSRYLQCPVLDKTDLKGSFDFKATYLNNNPNTEEELVNSIVASVEEIGLKLEPSTGQVNTLVVDNAEPPPEDGLIPPMPVLAAQTNAVPVP
jgi:uncharacterized protein (TIGR03435 family)